MHRIVFALIALTATALAWSQPVDPCKTQETTIDIDACGAKTLALADKALNVAYQKLVKRLTPDDKAEAAHYAEVRKQLLESQRLWIRFKDADCNAKYTLWQDGTVRGITKLSCLQEHSEQRTRELLVWAGGEKLQ